MAEEVRIQDDGIVVQTYTGRKVQMSWEDIARSKRFQFCIVGRKLCTPTVVVRLEGEDGSRIYVTSEMEHFPAVMDALQGSTEGAPGTTPFGWMERLALGGFRQKDRNITRVVDSKR